MAGNGKVPHFFNGVFASSMFGPFSEKPSLFTGGGYLNNWGPTLHPWLVGTSATIVTCWVGKARFQGAMSCLLVSGRVMHLVSQLCLLDQLSMLLGRFFSFGCLSCCQVVVCIMYYCKCLHIICISETVLHIVSLSLQRHQMTLTEGVTSPNQLVKAHSARGIYV